jgi:hypothetical protein
LLPQKTEQVWTFLRAQPLLAGFTLIGGSALALLIRHRTSEDLDFVYCEETLPTKRLNRLQIEAEQKGFIFARNDSQVAVEEFNQGGLDIHDYQQDFVVNDTVKVSFFTGGAGLCRILSKLQSDTPRVANLQELFKAKSLVAARRSKTRDWLDLYLLFRKHDFSLSDFRAAFVEAHQQGEFETALNRICSGVPQKDDEGYSHLLDNAPALIEMVSFFREERDKLEKGLAAESYKKREQQ